MTTRKERYKKLHEDLAKESKGTLFARRQLTKDDQDKLGAEDWDGTQVSPDENYQVPPNHSAGPANANSGHRSANGSFTGTSGSRYSGGNGGGKKPPLSKFGGKAKQPRVPKVKKKQRRHPVLSFLLKVLVVLLVYCVGAFTFGKLTADQQSVLSDQELKTFNGMSASDGSSNILLLGSDSREGETARSDTIMVLQLDGPSHKPKLVSFMRDTLVSIPGYGQTKLNAAYAYGGAELVRQTLSQNFGIDCKYYTIVDFLSFESVIDTLFPKGVEIDAEKDMSSHIDVPITAGVQMMDGHTLLQYARFRMDEEGDFGRVRRQQQVMNAVFSSMKNPLVLVKLPYAAGKVMGEAATDLTMTFLLKNTFSIAKGAGGIDRLSVPIDNSWSYGTDDYGGSVLVVNKEQNQQAVEAFFNE